jgi:2-dehydro-3-deoxyphosphooctonate aldolase (KDO 8-P synthase)
MAAQYVDVPKSSFLSNDNLPVVVAAANTAVKVKKKKDNVMSPESMKHKVQKKYYHKNTNVMVTDRGVPCLDKI